MQLYYATGDREHALKTYETCRETLKRELNAQPTAETKALAEQIRTEELSRRELREPAHPLMAVDVPLVGRADEYAKLLTAYQAVRRGRRSWHWQDAPGAGVSSVGKNTRSRCAARQSL